MPPLLDLDDSLLARLNLRRIPGAARYEIIVPEFANIAGDTVGHWATHGRADCDAIIHEHLDGRVERLSYAELDARSRQCARQLAERGVARGDVVAIHTGARIETAITHLAVYKLGAIAATISQLTGPDSLEHILNDSGAVALVTEDSVWASMREVRRRCPKLRHCIVVGAPAGDEEPFSALLEGEATFEPVRTRAEDPTLLIYTSGSTGMPKGVLHGHRILHAYKTSLSLFFNIELQERGLVFWTPADWAWVGGLVDVVYPAWAYGHVIVSSQHRFDPEWALGFMAKHGVTHSLVTPTGLKRMAQVTRPRERWPALRLKTIFTGGEALPGETLGWLNSALGIVCNEGYGTSEVNHMIGNCQALRPIKPGSMGWELPGHVAMLVDETGEPVADGEVGEVVTTDSDPTFFLGYWGRPDLTAAMRLGRWIRTRDLAVRDEDGYYWYRGRNDDLIKSAGYRIGPTEIEEVLLRHPAVAEAAVIGSPDKERGQIVKAFIKLAAGYSPSEPLVKELQGHVRSRLAVYKYPRQIEFVDDFPVTSSGKVSRAELRRREAAGR
ncbi:MAG: AMP-binding protein [Alphaproteobacteria bacterium]